MPKVGEADCRRRRPSGYRQLPQGLRHNPSSSSSLHRELQSGAADNVLDSLRQRFDEHAAAIAAARDLIPAGTDLAQWLSTARPNAVEAWQQLPGHLAAVDRVGRIAASFGARPSARFPLFVEQGYTDNRLVSDVALFWSTAPPWPATAPRFCGSAPPHTGHHPGSQSGN